MAISRRRFKLEGCRLLQKCLEFSLVSRSGLKNGGQNLRCKKDGKMSDFYRKSFLKYLLGSVYECSDFRFQISDFSEVFAVFGRESAFPSGTKP